MKISKSKLRQIIKEELSGLGESYKGDYEWGNNPANPSRPADADLAAGYPADTDPDLGDLQSTDRFTGGSREEQMNILINARDVLSKMSDEKLEELSKSLDAAQTAALRHLLANPLYAKTQSVTSTGPWAPEK